MLIFPFSTNEVLYFKFVAWSWSMYCFWYTNHSCQCNTVSQICRLNCFHVLFLNEYSLFFWSNWTDYIGLVIFWTWHCLWVYLWLFIWDDTWTQIPYNWNKKLNDKKVPKVVLLAICGVVRLLLRDKMTKTLTRRLRRMIENWQHIFDTQHCSTLLLISFIVLCLPFLIACNGLHVYPLWV